MGRGFGGMPKNMNSMMKQFEKMQKEMEKTQKELEEKTVETTSGGGAIKGVMNGKKELFELVIDKDIIDPEDQEMLQDMVIACVNSAIREVDELTNKEMSKFTGGLNIPGVS